VNFSFWGLPVNGQSAGAAAPVTGQDRRADVDGLRAIAVALVVVFHAFPQALQGGFLGVDVFFVISGYVITRRLLGHNETLGAFYISRARRLLPALYVTIVASLVAGFLLMGPGHFKQLAESSLAAVAGAANIYFWSTSGYFETDSIYRPLLHLWTLGVEMQFYLIWPVVLLLFRQNARFWIVLAAALSFILMLALPDRVAVFYNVWGRAFEFIIGASLVLAPRYLQRSNLLLLAGLIAIGYSAWTMTEDHPLPGVLSLIPCLGAAAVIHAGQSRIGAVLIANRFMVHVGALSYSLYLVHWPLIVFWAYYRSESLSLADYVMMSVVLVVLAEALHAFVEQAFRRPGSGAFRAIAVSTVAALGLGGTTVALEGMPFRIGAPTLSTAAGYDGCDDPYCQYPENAERLDFVVLGDSHSRHLYAGFKQLADEAGLAFGVFHLVPHCSPITGLYDEPNYDCAADQRLFQKVMATQKPSHLIFAARWKNFDSLVRAERIAELMDELPLVTDTALVLAVPEVYLTRDPIECEVPPYIINLAERCRTAYRDDPFYARSEAANDLLMSQFPNVDLVLDPFDVLCDQDICNDKVGGYWAYSDGNHLSAPGSQYLIKGFYSELLEWLRIDSSDQGR
jgi:peptidoglycan/LPS O-acetylase OafA/YrhL